MPPPREQRLNDIHQLWTTFAERFQALAAEKTRDAALAYPGYASAFLKKCGRTRSASAAPN
jgi:5-methylthioribose kinase